jgi:hypothetical protein
MNCLTGLLLALYFIGLLLLRMRWPDMTRLLGCFISACLLA